MCRDAILYVLECNGKYKIGKTIGTTANRIKQLQTGNSERIVEVCSLYSNNVDYVEKYWHDFYKDKRVAGEWFSLDEKDISHIVKYTPSMVLPNYDTVSEELLDKLMDCSRPAQWVFRQLKAQIKWDPYENRISYVAIIQRKTLSKADEKKFDRGISELIGLDLVRRLKPGHYIINPNALVPDSYETWIRVWNRLKGAIDPQDPNTYLDDYSLDKI